MTNAEAIIRLQAKLRYTQKLIEVELGDERKNFWRQQDIAAFELAVAALEYLHNVQEYEASQVPIA